MATHALGYAPEDPIGLVESCYRAIEWILTTHTARGVLIPRPWVDHPYGEEEITLLEEELLPAMAVFLARVDAIDRAIEADQEAEVQALEASAAKARWGKSSFCLSFLLFPVTADADTVGLAGL